MENVKKPFRGVLLHEGDFFVIVRQKVVDGMSITVVDCPFKCNRLGFVDMLDRHLKKKGYNGVCEYIPGEVVSCVVVDKYGLDLFRILGIVREALRELDKRRCLDLGAKERLEMQNYVLFTKNNWMTYDEFIVLKWLQPGLNKSWLEFLIEYGSKTNHY